MQQPFRIFATSSLCLALCVPSAFAGSPQSERTATKAPAKWAPAVKPKPLSKNVKQGLKWLIRHQLDNGGWGQGEESRNMGGRGKLHNKSNVADTCIATLALLRAGSTPKAGPHKKALNRAIGYVLSEIEESDDQSLFVTNTRGTRVQGKLGPYIDTFLSAQVLAEVKNDMPNEDAEIRVLAALDKVLTKIRRNQKKDGSFGGGGWAPVLSQAVAGKAVNRAAQAGAAVDEGLRNKLGEYAEEQFNEKGGSFGGKGSAGVDLYAAASSVGTLRDTVNSDELERKKLEREAAKAPTPQVRAKVNRKIQRLDKRKAKQRRAEASIVAKTKNARWVSGFGSNGGEEFLSYMLISESLVAKGGKEWKAWDTSMTRNLGRVQNKDGSWTGHHCITGRTFVTSAALLVLTADRAPVPLASKIKGR